MQVVWLIVGVVVGTLLGAVVTRRARDRWTPHVVAPTTAGSVGEPVEASAVPVDGAVDVAHLQEALDAMALGVVIYNRDRGVVMRNRRASSGATGSLHSDVLVAEAIDAVRDAALRGESGRRELELFGPPACVVVVSSSPLGDGGAIVTVEDVTERSRVDTVRTDFVANVSHELKTPVGAIAVLAETLVDERDLAVVQRLATKMVVEAHRMASTIDDLLELSRIELGGDATRLPVHISGVIAEAVRRVEAEAERHRIAITVECDPEAVVDGDSRQLASALGNLVENAVKYSDDGGQVCISAVPRDAEIEISVTDTGVGIPARDLDRVFERFYRVDRARSRVTGGTGLGLAIVRHVATNHGGRVTVVSREGEGSTFTFVVPARSSQVSVA